MHGHFFPAASPVQCYFWRCRVPDQRYVQSDFSSGKGKDTRLDGRSLLIIALRSSAFTPVVPLVTRRVMPLRQLDPCDFAHVMEMKGTYFPKSWEPTAIASYIVALG